MRWTGRLKNKGHPNKPKHKSVSHKSSVAVSADTHELWTKSVYDCKTEKEAEEFLRKTQKTRDRDQVTVYMAKWRKLVFKEFHERKCIVDGVLNGSAGVPVRHHLCRLFRLQQATADSVLGFLITWA